MRGPLCWLGVLGFATDVSSLQESSIWEPVWVWWGSLERQSGTRFTLLVRHRKSISYSCRLRAHLCSLGLRLRLRDSHVSAEQSVTKAKRLPATFGAELRYLLTITLSPTGLVNVCPVKVLFSSKSTGIGPPPSPILVGGPRIYHFPMFYVRGRLSGVIYHFSTCWWWRSSSSPLFSVTGGPMSVLSMLSSLLRSANGRMTSGQLVKSSFVKIDVDSQDRIRLLLIPYC